jgi:hypothetical protein
MVQSKIRMIATSNGMEVNVFAKKLVKAVEAKNLYILKKRSSGRLFERFSRNCCIV